MHNRYAFRLIHEKQGLYYAQGRAMHIMAGILLFLYAFPYFLSFSDQWIMGLGVGLPSLMILAVALFKRPLLQLPDNNRMFRILEAGFLIMGSMHFLQKNQILPCLFFAFVASVMMFLLYLESRIFQPQGLYLGDEGVIVELPLATKSFSWTTIQDLQYRNHYITITMKDGRQLQFRVAEPSQSLVWDEIYTWSSSQINKA
jgi:hypothetical protein